jgi:hypothetical protein
MRFLVGYLFSLAIASIVVYLVSGFLMPEFQKLLLVHVTCSAESLEKFKYLPSFWLALLELPALECQLKICHLNSIQCFIFAIFLRRGSHGDRAGEKTSLPLARLCPEPSPIGQLVPVHSPPSPSSSPFLSPELSSAATKTATLQSNDGGGPCSFEPDRCAVPTGAPNTR